MEGFLQIGDTQLPQEGDDLQGLLNAPALVDVHHDLEIVAYRLPKGGEAFNVDAPVREAQLQLVLCVALRLEPQGLLNHVLLRDQPPAASVDRKSVRFGAQKLIEGFSRLLGHQIPQGGIHHRVSGHGQTGLPAAAPGALGGLPMGPDEGGVLADQIAAVALHQQLHGLGLNGVEGVSHAHAGIHVGVQFQKDMLDIFQGIHRIGQGRVQFFGDVVYTKIFNNQRDLSSFIMMQSILPIPWKCPGHRSPRPGRSWRRPDRVSGSVWYLPAWPGPDRCR